MLKRILLAFALAFTAATAAASVPPETFVRRSEARYDALRQLGDDASRLAGCRRLVGEAFDSRAIARAVAADRWNALTPANRSALEAAVAKRLAGECRNQLDRPGPVNGTVRRIREIEGGVRITVDYQDENGAGSVLTWTLRPGGAWGWTALDLQAEGRGMVASLRADFEGALDARGGNVAAAIADLAGKGSA
jgi:ABC-type transporter MlaC component